MITKKNHKKKKAKTYKKKNIYPSFKILHIGYPLYASKKYKGDELLEYQRQAEMKSQDSCLLDNSSWFGDYVVAKSYKTNETKLYEWKTNKMTKLLNINKENEFYFKNLFLNTNRQLIPAIHLSDIQMKQIVYDHPYIQMSNNEKAYYEFCFAFGYITLAEQVAFMKLIKYLIDNKIITMFTRGGKSVLPKMKLKIAYYQLNRIFIKKKKYNRLSFYYLDKHAIMNLCKIVSHEVAGVYQKNEKSFWFPNLLVYKMNIQEYILFNPHHNLVYDKECK